MFSCTRESDKKSQISQQANVHQLITKPTATPQQKESIQESSIEVTQKNESTTPPTTYTLETSSGLPELASKEPLSPEQLFLMQKESSHYESPSPSPTQTPDPLELNDTFDIVASPSPTEEPLFTKEDLMELRADTPPNDSPSPVTSPPDRIAGVRRTAPSITSTSSSPSIFPEKNTHEDVSKTESVELPFVGGQSRGYTILNLMQPDARSSVNAMVEVMVKSNVRDLYLGVLVDGTFHWDPQFLRSVIRKLNIGERRLFLVLYLSSGPTMRRYATTPITAAFSQIEPEHFRRLIRWDQEIRQKFAGIASRVRPIASLNNTLNPDNRTVAIVMLEDNLERESYWAARALAKSVLGATVEFYRNPCLGCYSGNDGDSQGDPIEVHTPLQMPPSSNTFGISLDGTGFYHSFESPDGSLSFGETKKAIQRSLELGAEFFGLWRADRQGLQHGADTHPSEREYAIPTVQQKNAEAELLRYGLKEVKILSEAG